MTLCTTDLVGKLNEITRKSGVIERELEEPDVDDLGEEETEEDIAGEASNMDVDEVDQELGVEPGESEDDVAGMSCLEESNQPNEGAEIERENTPAKFPDDAAVVRFPPQLESEVSPNGLPDPQPSAKQAGESELEW